jgi:hypothetical protein
MRWRIHFILATGLLILMLRRQSLLFGWHNFSHGIEIPPAARRVRRGREDFRKIFWKKLRVGVDDPTECCNFVVPLNAGLRQTRVRRSVFSRLLGLQIELNFVPVYHVPRSGAERSEDGIEFFDARKSRSNRWFFEIYIQGSKYNFLELSLKL